MICRNQLTNIITKIGEIYSFYIELDFAINYISFLKKKNLNNCNQIYSIKFDDYVSCPKYHEVKKNIECKLYELDAVIFEKESHDIVDTKLIRLLQNKSNFDKCCETIEYYAINYRNSISPKQYIIRNELPNPQNKKYFSINELIKKIEYLKLKIKQNKELMITLVRETEIIDDKTTYYVTEILKILKFFGKDSNVANNENKLTNKFKQKNNLFFSKYE